MLNLKTLRKQAGYTQSEMAEAFNMSLRGYQAIENGINETSYANLIRFADYFGCSVDYLLGHQSQSIFHLDSFSPLQRSAISLIKKLDDDKMLVMVGYLAKLTNTPLEDVLPD